MCGVRPNQRNSTVFTKTWKNLAKTPKLQKIAQSHSKNWPSAPNLAHPFARRLHEGPPTRRTPLHPFARRLHEGWGDFCHQIHNFGKRNHFFPFLRLLCFFCSLWARGAFFWLKRFCRLIPRFFSKKKAQKTTVRHQWGCFLEPRQKINKMVEFRSLTRSSQDEEDSPSPQTSPDFPKKNNSGTHFSD